MSGVTNIGWIVDRSQSDLYPRFIQTAGPDVTNPANFRPTGNNLTVRNQDDYEEVSGLTGNVRLQVLPQQPLDRNRADGSWGSAVVPMEVLRSGERDQRAPGSGEISWAGAGQSHEHHLRC